MLLFRLIEGYNMRQEQNRDKIGREIRKNERAAGFPAALSKALLFFRLRDQRLNGVGEAFRVALIRGKSRGRAHPGPERTVLG